jgi:glycosyltransferase involved in cell wall biosynthesis
MRILFIQYGDYAEAYDRLSRGEPETYRDQYRSVAHVAALAGARSEVTTIALCETAYARELAPGLQAIGMRRSALDSGEAERLLTRLAPDRLVCRTPHPGVLAAARRLRIPTLPCFADLFGTGLGGLLYRARLRRALAGENVPCVGNHSLNASRSVVVAGLAPASRVVPWDWSRLQPDPVAKTGVADRRAPRLFFAGKMAAEKGLGDAIAALAPLHERGLVARLTVAGAGDPAPWQEQAARLGMGDHVSFLGRIANTEVRRQMALHDAVLVPSRHAYPEGLPNTIYEALASRSALILSDHPAFLSRLPDTACLMVPEADPAALAAAVGRLADEPELYARLSSAAPAALNGLYVGLEWPRLVDAFLADPQNRSGWVAGNSLEALALGG